MADSTANGNSGMPKDDCSGSGITFMGDNMASFSPGMPMVIGARKSTIAITNAMAASVDGIRMVRCKNKSFGAMDTHRDCLCLTTPTVTKKNSTAAIFGNITGECCVGTPAALPKMPFLSFMAKSMVPSITGQPKVTRRFHTIIKASQVVPGKKYTGSKVTYKDDGSAKIPMVGRFESGGNKGDTGTISGTTTMDAKSQNNTLPVDVPTASLSSGFPMANTRA